MRKYKHKIIYIIGFFLAIVAFFNKAKVPFLFEEINCLEISSIIGKNLFDEYTSVTDEDIYVLDYKLSNNILIIEPMNNEVKLPINGIIKNKTKTTITISTTSGDIIISNITNIKYYLYQYYNAYSQLGSSEQFLITGNIELLINDYKIQYEKI